jgi:hypothetical protein
VNQDHYGVEPIRVEQSGLIMVAQDRHLGIRHDLIEALAWIGAIADHVTQAVNFVHFMGAYVIHDRQKRLKVSMNIADQRSLHRKFLITSIRVLNNKNDVIAMSSNRLRSGRDAGQH